MSLSSREEENNMEMSSQEGLAEIKLGHLGNARAGMRLG